MPLVFAKKLIVSLVIMISAGSACAQPNPHEPLEETRRSHELNLRQAQRVIEAAQAEIEQINRRNSGRVALLHECLDLIMATQAFPRQPDTPERIRADAALETAQWIALSIHREIKTEHPRLLELNQLVEERKAYQQRIRTIYFANEEPSVIHSPILRKQDELDAAQLRIGELTKQREIESGAAEAFEELQGSLRWPTQGKIVYPFGEFTHPQYNITIKNTGLDLRVESGSAISAIAAGEVVFVGEMPGLNQSVIIDHGGGYMSVYGNILDAIDMNVSVEAGVAIGEVIGSASGEFAVFHFALFREEEPLNPVLWLKSE